MKNRKFILTLVFILLSLNSFAQEFKVEGLKMVSSTASLKQEICKDINDVPCALIHVFIPESNVKFSGNIIGDVLYDGRKYTFNVTNGTKKLTIVKKGVMPFNLLVSEYTKDFTWFMSDCEYEIKLSTFKKNIEVTGKIHGHDYVDMGTRVKWATCNIGANEIYDFGYLYGDGVKNITDCNSEYLKPWYVDEEFVDRFGNLQLSHDPAHISWGGSWTLPKYADFIELEKKCKRMWTFKNGIRGILFIAANGNQLFLPASEDENQVVECGMADGTLYQEAIEEGYLYFRQPTSCRIRPVTKEPYEPEPWQDVLSMKPDGYINGHGYVDLGLSVKWATMNVGANSQKEYGSQYAWAEVSAKDNYTWNDYKYGGKREWGVNGIYKEEVDKQYGPNGNNTLRAVDDVANVKWGTYWRVPSPSEFNELINKCEWKWTNNYKLTGVAGYIIISNVEGHTDKAIFLPEQCRYWTNHRLKEFYEYGNYYTTSTAEGLSFYNESLIGSILEKPTIVDLRRCDGNFIRPITK